MKKYFCLFSNCIPVKGYKRSIICDIQRQEFKFIPNSFYYLLTEVINKSSINKIKKEYDSKVIDEYIQFLEQNEYGFWCSGKDKERFPELSLEWDFPAQISNAIIDIKDKIHPFNKIFQQLEKLGCKYIQLRFYKFKDILHIERILKELDRNIIKSVQIILPYTKYVLLKELKTLTAKYNRISSIIISGALEDKIIEKENEKDAFIVYRKKEFASHYSCGVIDPKRFTPNIQLFTEAQKHNTCLNRKISIDETGEIKNCPSSLISFGNINNITLIDALKHPELKKYWFINKGQIDVCKDCEFRYICTDCRIYTKNKDNIYSKPSKCNYDPYTATFKN